VREASKNYDSENGTVAIRKKQKVGMTGRALTRSSSATGAGSSL
jgi:hypothetical protein